MFPMRLFVANTKSSNVFNVFITQYWLENRLPSCLSLFCHVESSSLSQGFDILGIGCSFISQYVPPHDTGVPDCFDLRSKIATSLLCFCNNKHLEKPSVLVSLSAPFPKMTLQLKIVSPVSFPDSLSFAWFIRAISSALVAWNVEPWHSFDLLSSVSLLPFFLLLSLFTNSIASQFFTFALRNGSSNSSKTIGVLGMILQKPFILFVCFSLFVCLCGRPHFDISILPPTEVETIGFAQLFLFRISKKASYCFPSSYCIHVTSDPTAS